MSTNQFELLLETISSIIQQIPTLNNDIPNLYDFLFNLNENDANNRMDDDYFTNESMINNQILNDSLKLLDTKLFTEKLTTLLDNSSNDTCCYNISCICYFVLIKSKFKIHQSMFATLIFSF